MTPDEIKKLRLEKFQIELEIKKAELAEKKKELKKPNRDKKKITIEQATILVAIIGFIGSFLGNFLEGYYAQQQKGDEFQSNLITKAVEKGNSQQSKDNLKFLLDAGLIKDPGKKIEKMVKDPTYKINFISDLNLADSVQQTDLEMIVGQICNAIGISRNFVLVPENNLDNIYATVKDEKRLLVYDPKFLHNVRTATKTNWSIVMMLAHECSHHLLGHTFQQQVTPEQNRQYELDADQTAGFILAKMGATLEESESALKSMNLPEKDSDGYPGKSSKINAVEKGWNNAMRKQ